VANGDGHGSGAHISASAKEAMFRECDVSGSLLDGTVGAASTTRDAAGDWHLAEASASVASLTAGARWDDVSFSGNVAGDARVVTSGAASPEISVHARARDVHLKGDSGPPARWSTELPDAKFDAAVRGAPSRGPVNLVLNRLAASIGHVSMTADATADLSVAATEVASRFAASVTGSVEIRNASLWNGQRRVENWWARLRVDPTRVTVDRTVGFAGRVSARFRDGLPGLLALSRAGDVPGWLPRILPLNNVTAQLDVRRRCELTDITATEVSGGPLVGRGRIQNSPGDTKGAVLVQLSSLGLVSAGIDVGDPGGVSLFAGNDWLAKKLADFDSTSKEVESHPCKPPAEERCAD
jgi:hypothetical protein